MTDWKRQFKRALGRELAPTAPLATDSEAFHAAVVQLAMQQSDSVVVVLPTLPEAERVAADAQSMHSFLDIDTPVYLLPEVETTRRELIPEQESERSRLFNLTRNQRAVFVASVMSALAPAPDPDLFHGHRLSLTAGEQAWPPEKLAAYLVELDYDNEAQVHVPGEFSWRGGILDVFSPVYEYPIRLDYFGDELESLRFFDPATQRSREQTESCRIIPRGEFAVAGADTSKHCFFDHFLDRWHLIVADRSEVERHLDQYGTTQQLRLWQRHRQQATSSWQLDDRLMDQPQVKPQLLPYFALSPHFERLVPDGEHMFEVLFRQFLSKELRRWHEDGYRILVSCAADSKLERFREVLAQNEATASLPIAYAEHDFASGLILPQAHLVLLTSSEIFRQSTQPTRRRSKHVFHADRMLHGDLEMVPGDFAVHAVHGVCRYAGLRQEKFREQVQEVMVLEFRDEVKVFVPLDQAYLVSRYVGGSKKLPTLSKVTGTLWQKAKAAAERSVTDLAADLIRMQALRETIDGFAFVTDEAHRQAFNDAFPFEETEDQLRAAEEIFIDMQRRQPMDRLLCGDVGYGKTEVAMRAAFQAVLCGKQVAVLVPTTVLVQQHYLTFTERFSQFPMLIESISRFRTAKEQREIVAALADGRIDIIIGTHRLLGKDIRFSSLGLVIIDEEQRFGVVHKERLKQLRVNVDILTMTATPIPRTLYLSMAGLRDTSTIMTAPLERRPVRTVVAQFDEELIEEAICRELQRGGQVFFLHNRVKSIERMCEKLERLVPEARFDIGHGQMHERDLEAVMMRFFRGDVDVLVCTTIIESGLDVPNANTIIINDAQRFGLADLYQLRGRVGRYDRQAYAYLLLPRHGVLLDSARQRLGAIRKYTQLGAGFKLAMRDLEIRGAGNLLGSEQSGHIAAIGFDLYCQLMREAVARIKQQPSPSRHEIDLNIEFVVYGYEDITDRVAAALPPTYIREEELRVGMYRRFSDLQDLAAVSDFADELSDRFGPLPAPTVALLDLARLKVMAGNAGVHSITVRHGRVLLETNTGLLRTADRRLPELRATEPRRRLRELLDRVAELTAAG